MAASKNCLFSFARDDAPGLKEVRASGTGLAPTPWRREWDSNPRLLRVTGFQDQLLKPLGHLSELLSSETLVIIPYAVMLVKCSLKNFHAIFPVKY